MSGSVIMSLNRKICFILLAIFLAYSIIPIQEVSAQEAPFEINQKLTIVSLKAGETIKKNIVITSKSKDTIPVSLSIEGSKGTQTINIDNFDLEPGGFRQVEVAFLSDIIGINTGKLVVKSKEFKKELPFIVETWSASARYVPKLDIPAEFREASPNSELNFRLSIISQAPKESKLAATYKVLDFNNKALSEKTEDFVISDTLSVLRKISLASLEPGDYILGVVLQDANSTSTGTKIFTIEKPKSDIVSLLSENLLYVLITIVIVVTVLLYINYGKLVTIEKKRGKGIIKRITKIQVIKTVESRDTIESAKLKLEKKLASLKEAYKSGFIKKESYINSTEEIQKMLDSVNKKLKRERR